jgi:WD40 repeat protein
MRIAGLFLLAIFLFATPAAAVAPLWSSDFGEYAHDVAISEDGNTVIVTTATTIHGFDRNGTLLWRYTEGLGVTSVVLSRDGQRIAAGIGNRVILLDRNGTRLWNVTNPAHPLHCVTDTVQSVAVSDDGFHVAAGTSDGNVMAIDGDGEVQWEQNKNLGAGQVLIDNPGDFVVSQLDSRRIDAFDRSGNVSWWQVLPAYITGMVMTRDDTVIAGTNGGEVDLYNGTGHRVWTSTLGGRVNDLAAAPDGSTIVAGAGDWTVNNLDRDGILRWTRELDADVTSVSTSSDGRTIAAGSANSTAFCYAGNGSLLWEFVPRTDISRDYEGTMVAVSGNGQVIAVLARQAYDSYGNGVKVPCTCSAVNPGCLRMDHQPLQNPPRRQHPLCFR